jgi:hypothetical protein
LKKDHIKFTGVIEIAIFGLSHIHKKLFQYFHICFFFYYYKKVFSFIIIKMTSIYKRSQINLYDNVEGEYKFSLAQGQQSCAMDVPTQWHVSTEAFKLTSGVQVVNNVAASILANSAAVTAEQSRAETKEAELKTALDDEVASRISADSQEAVARQQVQTNLNAESSARVSADQGLQQSIDQEASSRLQADLDTQDQITDIQTAHATFKQSSAQDRTAIRSEFAAADSALDAKITTEKDRIDAILALSIEELNTFKEIADAYTNADSSLQSLITTLTSRFDALEQVVNTLAPYE